MKRIAALQHRGVAHVGVEQYRARLEALEAIRRAVELPRHGEPVGHAAMLKDTKVGTAENLRPRAEIDAVARRGHARDLMADALQPMKIHDDPPPDRINMHVRRGDVRCRDLRQHVVRDRRPALAVACLERRQFVRRGHRRRGQKARLGQMQAARRMHRHGPASASAYASRM
jgi:hypothetical protein